MEIFNELVQFFQLGNLLDCETFPEFFGVLIEIIFAIAIVVFFFKVVFYACFKVEDLVK